MVSTYVVATHKVRNSDVRALDAWVPYGTKHGWQPGSRSTLCGQAMTGWAVFWELPFGDRIPQGCPECAELSLPEASRRRLDPRHTATVHHLPEQPRVPGRAVPRAS